MSKDYLSYPYQDVILEVKGRIAYVTLNRPRVLNAMTMNTKGEIVRIFQGIDQDTDVWGAIITGAGKSFNVGSDVSHHPANCEEAFDEITFSQNVLTTIEKCSKPVIAAINGYCLGGGIELALVCDLRIASEKASFGLPEAKLGVIPSYGGTQRMTRLCGAGVTKDLCYTCRRMNAEEALRVNLINRLVPHEQLMEEATKYMEEIIVNAPLAIKYIKYSINNGAEISLEKGLEIEKLAFAMCIASEDCQEGMKAFAEKRAPEFHCR